jgi:hypothetical protein
MRIANRFPEVIMTDATCTTNSSNRPLIYVCGIDSTHKNICVCSSLTSNERKDSFAFIIENLALLYGKAWCSRVQVFLSDGATEITSAIDNAIVCGIFNPNKTKRFLCHFHAVNIKAAKDLTHLKNDYEVKLRTLLCILIYKGFRELETFEESKMYFRAVKAFLDSMQRKGKLSSESHVKFIQFLEAVLNSSAHLSNLYAKDVLHLGTHTTGRNESENSSSKATGVNPGTSILKLAVADNNRNSNRAFETNLRVQKEALKKPIQSIGYDDIAVQITSKAWDLLQEQLSAYPKYDVFLIKSFGIPCATEMYQL